MKHSSLIRTSRLFHGIALLALITSVNAQSGEPKTAFSAGQKAPAFKATTTDGKTINFPADYKGKVVLLDFWATWCPPCRAEVPNLAKAFERFHSQNFEVLGVSLDQANAGSKLASFTKDNNMTWPQIYDGKYWKAAIAEQYGIRSIPRPLLVDGDTGLILAEGPEARGSKLAPAIEKALAAKKK